MQCYYCRREINNIDGALIQWKDKHNQCYDYKIIHKECSMDRKHDMDMELSDYTSQEGLKKLKALRRSRSVINKHEIDRIMKTISDYISE